jgi:hypothetical protein
LGFPIPDADHGHIGPWGAGVAEPRDFLVSPEKVGQGSSRSILVVNRHEARSFNAIDRKRYFQFMSFSRGYPSYFKCHKQSPIEISFAEIFVYSRETFYDWGSDSTQHNDSLEALDHAIRRARIFSDRRHG